MRGGPGITMKSDELVSVIIPCYNQGRYLTEAVESVFAQTYANIECIVVDDGSTDDTPAACEALRTRYADRKFITIRQENGGLSAARNTGLRVCAGAWINFLDADDTLCPDKILLQLGLMKERTECCVGYCKARRFSDSGDEWPDELIDQPDGAVLAHLVTTGNFLRVHSALVNRSVVNHVGDFDYSLANLEDWDYWLRCAETGVRFAFLPCELVRYRAHPGAMTNDKAQMILGEARSLGRCIARGNLPKALKTIAVGRVKALCIRGALTLGEKGDIKGARTLMNAAAKHARPYSVGLWYLFIAVNLMHLPLGIGMISLWRRWKERKSIRQSAMI